MNDIRCPHCKKTFKADQVFAEHIDEERKKFEAEKIKLREDAQKWREAKEKELQEEASKSRKKIEEELRMKLEDELSVKLKDSKNEAQELADKNRKQQEELLEMNKMLRVMKMRQEELELENAKKLAVAEEKIKEEALKKAEEKEHFKVLELEKKLADFSKINADLQRKIELGSQQAQGDVLEVETENLLREKFPYDEIKPVPTGIRGADIIQVVRDQNGRTCGSIVWETKRTQAWQDAWVQKLKDDRIAVKADIAVIASTNLPAGIKQIGEKSGVWICGLEFRIGIALLLRDKIIEVSSAKLATVNSGEKMQILYNYLTSVEFKHRVEAIRDSFGVLLEDIERERRWFNNKWNKQEKLIRRVIDQTTGMRGELKSIMGNELPDVQGVDMLPEEIEVSVEITEESTREDTLF